MAQARGFRVEVSSGDESDSVVAPLLDSKGPSSPRDHKIDAIMGQAIQCLVVAVRRINLEMRSCQCHCFPFDGNVHRTVMTPTLF